MNVSIFLIIPSAAAVADFQKSLRIHGHSCRCHSQTSFTLSAAVRDSPRQVV